MFKKKIPAIGISDFGNLFGSMEFSLEQIMEFNQLLVVIFT